MKFFIPGAWSAEETVKVYSAIKAHLGQELGAHFAGRKIRSLHWEHDGKKYEAEVGKCTSFNNEIVIAILYEPKRNLYHVCTPNRGVLRDISILAGGHSVFTVADFASKGIAQLGWWSGRDSGCPFCVARNQALPKVGEKIRLLSDFRAGQIGIVVETPSSLPLRPGEFLVEIEGEPPGHQRTVHAELELFEHLPGTPVPAWAPPISLREAEELDRFVIRICDESTWDHNRSPSKLLVYDLIRHVWWKRLLIEPDEMWQLLEAHGAPSRWRNQLMRLYRDGRDLLIYSMGRKPVKKQRVSPLSV